MKILFFGDSITDMSRNRNENAEEIYTYGSGYPMLVASALYRKNPLEYQVINRGIGGDRSVDLYARIKRDVWNLNPDVLSILVGINDRPLQNAGHGNDRQILQKVKLANNSRQKTISFCLYILPTNVLA